MFYYYYYWIIAGQACDGLARRGLRLVGEPAVGC